MSTTRWRRLVAEHADRDDLGGQPLDDVAGLLRGDLAGRRREHEADGVGAHGHGQEGVLLARDPADLDEHRWSGYRPRRLPRTPVSIEAECRSISRSRSGLERMPPVSTVVGAEPTRQRRPTRGGGRCSARPDHAPSRLPMPRTRSRLRARSRFREQRWTMIDGGAPARSDGHAGHEGPAITLARGGAPGSPRPCRPRSCWRSIRRRRHSPCGARRSSRRRAYDHLARRVERRHGGRRPSGGPRGDHAQRGRWTDISRRLAVLRGSRRHHPRVGRAGRLAHADRPR